MSARSAAGQETPPRTDGRGGRVWRGDKEISLAASPMFAGNKTLESNAVKIRCNFEDRLFAKKR